MTTARDVPDSHELTERVREMRFQVVSFWAGELLVPDSFSSESDAQAAADDLNKALSIDAVVREESADRPRNWLTGTPRSRTEKL